jgi:type II secretory pathway pseudopilin PulG
MRKFQLVVCVVLAGGLIAVWTLRQRTQVVLQQQTEALRQAQSELEQLRADNERLTNQISQTENSGREQSDELLRLRAEVTRLRQQTNQINALRAQNEQLRQRTAVVPEKPQAPKTPPEVPPQDIHPRDTWSFVGYTSPDATVQSMLWAITQTNREAFLAGLTAEMRTEIEKHFPADISDMAEKTTKNSAFRVVDRKYISDDEMDMTIYMDGDDHQETTRFKKINGEWKVAGDSK